MKHRLVAAILAALLLAGAASMAAPAETHAAPAAPEAPTHISDNYANWFCAQKRPANTVIVHAAPDFFTADYIRYRCRAAFFDHQWEYWVQAWFPLSNNISARPWPYHHCLPHGPGACTLD